MYSYEYNSGKRMALNTPFPLIYYYVVYFYHVWIHTGNYLILLFYTELDIYFRISFYMLRVKYTLLYN